jgi:membrane glycosyltransferase
VALSLFMAAAIFVSFAGSVTAWTPAAILALPLVGLTAIWISGGAATALLGLFLPRAHPVAAPAHWRPTSRSAILVTLCKEDPLPVPTVAGPKTGAASPATSKTGSPRMAALLTP